MSEESVILDPAKLLPFEKVLEESDHDVERLPMEYMGSLGKGIFDEQQNSVVARAI